MRWDDVFFKTFSSNINIIRDIFHDQHRYLLALRTPCSADYSTDAARISEMLALPLQWRWRYVNLEYLESVLQDLIEARHAQ